MKKFTLYLLFLLAGNSISAQVTMNQYFEGQDTLIQYSIQYEIDSLDTMNIWQVGPPQKIIFNAASSVPNVLVTDTINVIPIGDTSIVSFKVLNEWDNWGILAIQWKQKIDFDFEKDGGMVEFSIDGGLNWENAIGNPYVYNFYGFSTNNISVVNSSAEMFTGTDSTWKDIWLCYELSWISSLPETIRFRFINYSDTIDANNEGWMIDNMTAHFTWIHTINEVLPSEYMRVQPNPTNGIITIATTKLQEYHVIEQIEVYNEAGELKRKYGLSPTKFTIDISDQPDGIYFLKVKTNKKLSEFKVVLQH